MSFTDGRRQHYVGADFRSTSGILVHPSDGHPSKPVPRSELEDALGGFGSMAFQNASNVNITGGNARFDYVAVKGIEGEDALSISAANLQNEVIDRLENGFATRKWQIGTATRAKLNSTGNHFFAPITFQPPWAGDLNWLTPAADTALHCDRGNGAGSRIKFTVGTNSGQGTSDGVDFGIENDGGGYVKQWENRPFRFWRSSTLAAQFQTTGDFAIYAGLQMGDIPIRKILTREYIFNFALSIPPNSVGGVSIAATDVKQSTGIFAHWVSSLPGNGNIVIQPNYQIDNFIRLNFVNIRETTYSIPTGAKLRCVALIYD